MEIFKGKYIRREHTCCHWLSSSTTIFPSSCATPSKLSTALPKPMCGSRCIESKICMGMIEYQVVASLPFGEGFPLAPWPFTSHNFDCPNCSLDYQQQLQQQPCSFPLPPAVTVASSTWLVPPSPGFLSFLPVSSPAFLLHPTTSRVALVQTPALIPSLPLASLFQP